MLKIFFAACKKDCIWVRGPVRALQGLWRDGEPGCAQLLQVRAVVRPQNLSRFSRGVVEAYGSHLPKAAPPRQQVEALRRPAVQGLGQ